MTSGSIRTAASPAASRRRRRFGLRCNNEREAEYTPSMRILALCLLVALSACRSDPRPALALGAAAPDFALTGVDGRIHTLSEYRDRAVLAVVFTCNHCPA